MINSFLYLEMGALKDPWGGSNMPSVSIRASSAVQMEVSDSVKLQAIEQVRQMRGGAQSHLMRCSDGNHYVVKFQNNPQHKRILVNELLGTRLAELLGLPTTPGVVVRVSQRLIDLTEELVVELPRYRVPCLPGLQFGSRYFGNPRTLRTFDLVSADELDRIENIRELTGMVVFDKWTCNCDSRQCVFQLKDDGKYSMVGIDQGLCFNGGEWNFPDSPLRGLYRIKTIYRNVKTLADFEPWLGRLEHEFSLETLNHAAAGIPHEWYDNDETGLSRLLKQLDRRRKLVRELIRDSCTRLPLIFPKWEDVAGYAKPKRRERRIAQKAVTKHSPRRCYGN